MNVHDSASAKADATETATLSYNGKQVTLPVRSGSIGPDVIDVARLYRRHRLLHVRSGLHLDRRIARRRSPTSTATKACCCIAAIRSSSWPSSPTSSRSATCCCTASCRRRRSTTDFDDTRHAPHDGARADDPVLHRASAATRIRWRSWSASSARCRPSITTRPTSTIRSSA